MTDKATPRPWRIGFLDGSGARDGIYITANNEAVVWGGLDDWCVPRGVEKIADAELIVTAVNSYSPDKDEKVRALVEAAEGAANMCEVASRTMFDHGFNEAGHHFLAWTSTLRAALAALGETA